MKLPNNPLLAPNSKLKLTISLSKSLEIPKTSWQCQPPVSDVEYLRSQKCRYKYLQTCLFSFGAQQQMVSSDTKEIIKFTPKIFRSLQTSLYLPLFSDPRPDISEISIENQGSLITEPSQTSIQHQGFFFRQSKVAQPKCPPQPH